MDIIVTSPHSFCLSRTERDCDRVAHLAASRLLALLPGALYFPAPLPRTQIDLNRSSSRGTEYREAISNALGELAASANSPLLLDIHSFSKEAFDEVSVMILDNVLGTDYGRRLAQMLNEAGINTGYLYGNSDNDIVIEARSKVVPAILIEYNESLGLEKIDQINRVIAEWILRKNLA